MKSILLRLRIFIILLATVITAGIIGFMTLEGLTFADAIYFTIVTISTVGYGDIHASSTAGKVLAIFLIIAGVASFTGFIVNGTQMLIERGHERIRNERLNVLVGLFFSEIGTHLLHLFSTSDTDVDKLRQEVSIDQSWSDQDFAELRQRLERHTFNIDPSRMELEALRNFLLEKGDLLIRLLENPDLMEKERATELLRTALHLRDELILRTNISELPEKDIEHLANDARRVYSLLAVEWTGYMHYLRENFPYLFSLALRTSPFIKNPSPVVR